MNIVRKDAALTTTGADEDFPGTFEVILSAPTEDRDGETLLPGEWKMPLPERITFDSDHGMSVATTVGSGVPTLNDAGELVVSGTFSSLARAQEVRTLVKEGHIATTSVAFMTARAPQKDGKGAIVRELLNGAFVAIPSNREALVLSSKSGARNSKADAAAVQGIHDHAAMLGATCSAAEPDPAKSAHDVTFKSVAGSLEATQDRARDALNDAYPDVYVYLRATVPAGDGGTLVFAVEDHDTYESESYQQEYTDDGSTITLIGERSAADLVEVIVPDSDENAEPAAETDAAAAEKSAAAAAVKDAGDADSVQMQYRAVQAFASAYVTE